jgi:hypothetical protein
MKNIAEPQGSHSCVKGLGALLSRSLQTSGFCRKDNLTLNDWVCKNPAGTQGIGYFPELLFGKFALSLLNGLFFVVGH